MVRTKTPDTPQDMQIATKNINVICPYLAAVMQTFLTFLSPWSDQPVIVHKTLGTDNEYKQQL